MSDYMTQVIAGVQLLESRGDDARYIADMTGGGSTSSGQSMTWKRSLQNASVWSAIDLISGDISRLPIQLLDVLDGNVQDKVFNDLWRVLNKRPNELLNANKFWRSYAVHLLLWGNAYALVDRDGMGNVTRLVPLLPDRTYMETSVQMYRSSIWQEGNNWRDVLLDPSDVIHTQWMPDLDYNDWQGLTTWQMARDSWSMGLAHEDYLGSFFRSGGRAGGYLETPEAYGQEAREQILEDFTRNYGSTGNAFKAISLPPGVKFQEGAFSPRDAMSAESGDGHAKQVARWFGIPSSMMNVDGSVSYNSKSEDAQAYLDRCLAPHLAAIACELTFKLITSKMKNRWEFRHDTSQITRMDKSGVINSGATAIQNGIMSPNEVRELLGLPETDELENERTDPDPDGAEPEKEEPINGAERVRSGLLPR